MQTLHAVADNEFVLPDMRLRRLTQTLAGVVVDPDGDPVVGARVRAILKTGGFRPRVVALQLWADTDKHGRFCLTQLPDQPLELMAYVQPNGPNRRIGFRARLKCELNQRDIRMTLDPSLLDED